jgi:ABC-type Zn uptake system ZnuABC Zn-binding protein ZnuA
MSNLSENRINVVLAAADVTTINESINAILSKIPENTTLTDTQRNSYTAIDVSNKVFSEDVLTEARATGTGVLPPYIDLDALQNDLTIFNQLDAIESGLTNLLQRVKDAKRIAGHEAFGMANKAYKSYRDASDAGVANAKSGYDKLKVRFESQGKSGGRGLSPDLQ